MTISLKQSQIDTPLGKMVAIANEEALYLLEFAQRRKLEQGIERMRQKAKATIVSGRTSPIDSIEEELRRYFAGELISWKTAIRPLGTPFQLRVWQELQKIPFGTTCSYADLAAAIGSPSAFRAVARANSTNTLAIIIPCHRVINASGALGGYAGGLFRKEGLLQHEQEVSVERCASVDRMY